jgi:hypothetical protein
MFAHIGHAQKPLIYGNGKDDDDDDDDETTWSSMYVIDIGLGNPPLRLRAQVDTSWGPFFVPSVNCTLDEEEEP